MGLFADFKAGFAYLDPPNVQAFLTVVVEQHVKNFELEIVCFVLFNRVEQFQAVV